MLLTCQFRNWQKLLNGTIPPRLSHNHGIQEVYPKTRLAMGDQPHEPPDRVSLELRLLLSGCHRQAGVPDDAQANSCDGGPHANYGPQSSPSGRFGLSTMNANMKSTHCQDLLTGKFTREITCFCQRPKFVGSLSTEAEAPEWSGAAPRVSLGMMLP